MRFEKLNRQYGFTLIELSILMVIIGMLLLIVSLTIPQLTERVRLVETDVSIEDVAKSLTGFAAINGRLPCADVNGDGLEGTAGVCAVADRVGLVPYRELGLSDPILDEAHLPVRYAVYRNPGASADMATLSNLFIPVLSGDPPTNSTYTGLPDNPVLSGVIDGVGLTNPVVAANLGVNTTRVMPTATNDLDFCLALRNAKNSPLGTEMFILLTLPTRHYLKT